MVDLCNCDRFYFMRNESQICVYNLDDFLSSDILKQDYINGIKMELAHTYFRYTFSANLRSCMVCLV